MNGPDRRHRRLLGLPLLATALLAGACTADRGDQGQGATTAPTSVPTTAATPSASPTTGGTDTAVTIPKSAFVDLPPELRKSTPRSMQVADALPKLCAEEFATGGRSTAAAAMMSTYKTPEDPPENVPFGTLNQTVFAFAGTDAADYLRRVREAVESCRSFPDAGNTVTVRSRPLADTGDEGLLVTLTRPATNIDGSPREGTATSQITVVRVADGVTVVHDQGWEASSNNPDFADDFADAAVRGLKSWQT
ncbi:hypothetical protein O7602_19215 [Micromonospora sp. WMMD1128]|uniref:hypothetical protein n=1 Tax=Micromonospora sp. WMMD1128 TaxID=3015150 RepID=UPI00248D10EA|nr:hypothetical protein [Micromonospora sp. WMMD1128]WBB71862.1 hypothetical protein O7602_19215 [Micromonospora sp. WMMD1128]